MLNDILNQCKSNPRYQRYKNALKQLMMLEQNPSKEDLKDADYYDIALKSMADLDPNANEDQENELKRMVSYFFEREIKRELLKAN